MLQIHIYEKWKAILYHCYLKKIKEPPVGAPPVGCVLGSARGQDTPGAE